jgi:hypothetical protein
MNKLPQKSEMVPVAEANERQKTNKAMQTITLLKIAANFCLAKKSQQQSSGKAPRIKTRRLP